MRWEDKISRAVFTGNMKTSPNRRTIFNQAERYPELLFVNEVYIKTSPPSCFDIGEPNVTRGGVLVKRCGRGHAELHKPRQTAFLVSSFDEHSPAPAFELLLSEQWIFLDFVRLHGYIRKAALRRRRLEKDDSLTAKETQI